MQKERYNEYTQQERYNEDTTNKQDRPVVYNDDG